MAEKFITSRVKQRFDTLSEWQAIWETFKPLKGEVCKIQIPANTEVTGLRTSSSVRVMTKTGDGETTLALLPWDSAIGADETQLSKGTDKTASKSLSHGGTFTAITETSVSGHEVTDTTTTYTLPAETAVNVTSTAGSALTPAHGGKITVVTGVAKGTNSHDVKVTTQEVTIPSQTSLSKGTDATATAKTLAHGDTFTVLTDLTVSGHAITDKPTTFTLPPETRLSVTDNESGNAVTDVTVSGHTITLKRGKNFLTAHPSVSVGTDSTSTQPATHGGTFTAVDSITRDGNGHVTKINTKTVTLPADNDTKNTAGGGNTSSKIYIVGTLKQETGTSYTHDTAYVGTDGCLYSGGSKVLTSYTDTKNTTGSSNTSSKIYLVGATSQATNPVTYSHDTAYVGTDGHLYSNSSKVFSTSYAPEAYLQWGGKNFAGGWGPIDAAMVPNFAANRLAFFNKAYVTLEVSTDSGSTWTAVNNDTIKGGLFSAGTSFPLGNTTTTKVDKSKYMNRVTITTTNAQCYSVLNKFAIRISTDGSSGCYCTIDARTKANQDAGANTWVNFANKVDLAGWSGWNIINTSGITTHGNTTAQYSQIRFTFGVTSHAATINYPGMQILRIMAFGGEGWSTCSNMATDGHLYSYDGSQNATFPAGLNTTGNLTENGVRVSKTGHTHSVTAAGTVSKPTFTGTAASHNHSFTGTEAGHTHKFTGTAASHKHTFTGTAHDHSFTGSAVTSGGASATISINSVKSVGTAASHSYTAPSLTASCANQCLTLTWSAGSHSFTANTVPTVEAKTVATAHTHSVTAAGTVGSKTAGGTIADTSVTPAGTIAETKITPAGTVANKSITPAGTISQPTFTGTAVTSGGSSN